jgi:hypothetical protein
MHCFGVPKLWNISIGPNMMFRSVSDYFTNLRQVKRCKTCVSGLNTVFRGTEVVKHPLYSIGPKLMFRSVSECFSNLQQVKDVKLASEPECTISGHQSCETFPLVPKWCFGVFRSISLTLPGKTMQNLCFGTEYSVSGYRSSEASTLLHWTQIDVSECFGAFQ